MNILVQTAVQDLAIALAEASPAMRARVIDVCFAYTKHTNAEKERIWIALTELLYRTCNTNDLEIKSE